MCSDSMDGADKAELFPSETNSHPASSIPHSENVMRFLYFSKLLLHARWMKRLIINRKETNNRC